MKCPGSGSSSVPLSAAGDFNDEEEWTDFGGPCSCDCHTLPGSASNAQQQWTGQKKESVFELCFPVHRLPSEVIRKERKLLADKDNRLQ